MPNQQLIAQIGIDAFIERQCRRIAFLEAALEHYDDGRSKGFFCIAAALLSIGRLEEALQLASGGENLKGVLLHFAKNEGLELKLRK